MPQFRADLAPGDVLDLWTRPASRGSRSLVTLAGAGGTIAIEGGPTDDFARATRAVPSGGKLEASWDGATTEVSLAYSYNASNVPEDGIRLHWNTGRNRNTGRRHRLHLQSPFGWMNDPNGLCEVDGVTHVFFQSYPHSYRWNSIHWGHATSRNLVDWVHWPIFLDPRPELLADDAASGGAFSGSMVPLPGGGGRVIYTDREDARLPNWEWQMTATTPDFLHAGPSEPIVTEVPPVEGMGRDMRDPYVFRGPDGLLKMLIGAADANGGIVLLYETEHPEGAAGWRFVGTIHSEPASPTIPVECPCMVPLSGEGEGLYALVFSLIGHRDRPTRRRNLSFALVGRFDGRRFEPVARREFDFATDAYAFQGFVHAEHGPVGIAWAANWTDFFKDRDFRTAQTFPRRLVWRNGALLMPPVETVAELRVATLCDDPARLAGGIATPDGLAEIELEFVRPGAPFHLELAHPTHSIAIAGDDKALDLQFEPPGNRVVPRYATETGGIRRLRVFVDVGLIEVYADDGRWCGTKRIDSDEPVTALRLVSGAGEVETARVFRLRPARAVPMVDDDAGEE